MAIFKSRSDLKYLAEAARVAGWVADTVLAMAEPGMNTLVLETEANRLLAKNRATAPFKLFDGFGFATCISLNDEVVNGPPSASVIFQPGDVVSLAVGSEVRGFCGKAARTRVLSEAPPEDVSRLIVGTQACIQTVVEASQSTPSLKACLQAMAQTVSDYQLTLLDGQGGFGIGKVLHEAPWVPNHAEELEPDVQLVPGLAFVLMPMCSLGGPQTANDNPNGWTIRTDDGALSAHFADTLQMTESGLVNLSRV